MKHKDHARIVPVQHTGKEIETDAVVVLEDSAAAAQYYDVAKSRLLDVNSWHNTAGFISAVFQLVDSNGMLLSRPAAQEDFIRIDIPGPGSSVGDGYDWVQIEKMNEVHTGSVKAIGFRVRPVPNPVGGSATVAHFYAAAASSSFIVFQCECTVYAWIVDRNLEPNDQDTASLMDKIRDTTVGLSAIGLFSRIQWQQLVKGLLYNENKKP